ncbi:MAG: hydroxymethylbilane synthase [Gammaproteobacteria bacterium]
MTRQTVRIATRKSPLALWQAGFVRARLQEIHPGLEVTLLPLSTRGDKILDAPLAKVGGKALFVKELEQALIDSEADIAVHSTKDLPVDLPEGLELAVILQRQDPRDGLVSNYYDDIRSLPQQARVGTSSVRRQCQLLKLRPDLNLLDLRGNVGTRLAKLDAGEFDAIVLACAGLQRMELESRIRQRIDPKLMVPAIAQGAISIECRADDDDVRRLITPLDDADSHICIRAERAFNRRLMGGCQVPIGGYAEVHGSELRLRGMVGRPDGTELIYGEQRDSTRGAERLGTTLAEDILARGAGQILKDYYASV